MKIKLNLLLFTVLISGTAYCCDLCGSYFGIMPMENQNSFSIVHRYRVYNGYRSMNQNGQLFPTGAYRLSQPHSPLHGTHGTTVPMSQEDFESFKVFELKSRYFLSSRVQVDVVIPLLNNKMNAMGNKTNTWALGDVSLCLSYRALQSPADRTFRHRLMIGLGAKFPTGSDEKTFEDGDRLPFMLQPGSGSFDALAMFSYASSWKNWIIGVTSHNRYNFENKHHEQLGFVTNNSLVLARSIQKEKVKLYPQLQVYQEFTKGVYEHGYLISGTKMSNVLLGPGIEIFYGKVGFSSCIQLPVYQEVYEMNMEMTFRFLAGISYNFGGSRYLFN